MCDEWMPLIQLPLTIDQFRRLPRNPAYKYEYLKQQAFLTPRPRHYHALLDLKPIENTEPVRLARIRAEELMGLDHLFAAAFHHIQPYGCLDDATRLTAARQALERTRIGGDGPWIQQASFVAREDERLLGAILITLLPDGDPSDEDVYHWQVPPPPDCIARRLGRPHLTWIFVAPMRAGHGVGTALLSAAVQELLALGYTQLLSTFMVGNDLSMLWHWRNGFRLLAHPSSYRLMRQRWQTQRNKPGS
jgi:GNAT superfamily N-acetyltransferase